ncbi:hypothetical protein BDR07DRAFT_1610267 [Suillus spraguei]|nr:hypothetical protein BDR07DRAFT_1610267 [Suillus spraguei]
MTEIEEPVIRMATVSQTFEGHENRILGVTVFPDRRRMVTAAWDKTLRLWDLEDGVVLKIMEGHRFGVRSVAVSKDGESIVSADGGGELIAWNKDGESLTKPIKVHSQRIRSLDFSPDGSLLASGSLDTTTKFWNTKTWQVQGNPINCGTGIHCVRYSPSGEYLAIATKDIQIWNPGTGECVAKFQGHSVFNGAWCYSLAWTPDGKQLVSSGDERDPTIRIWDSLTWKQVGEPCKGHTEAVNMIALNPTGTLLTSASDDNQVRLWWLSDQRNIAICKHPDVVYCVIFSEDGKHILSGGMDRRISKWTVPLQEDILDDCKILAINTTARNACTTGDLPSAERLLTQEINADNNNYNSYANRSFVMARKADWDRAFDDALKSISIQPSLMGCISKGIAHCGKRQFQDAMKAFDLAFMYMDADLNKTRLLLLIKAIALFNANQHDEAILRVQELATTRPDAGSLACSIVEAYLHVQVGMNALDDARHNEAADHFTSAVNTIRFSSMSAIHSKYDVFVVLFGWDLKSLWQTAHQNWCHALFRAGRLPEAIKAHRYMMDKADETTRTHCLDWSTSFKKDCSVLYAAAGVTDLAASGDTALTVRNYDRAIELYSAAIDLGFATDTVFVNRSKARSSKMLWDDALLDAEKVIELNPSSYIGYQLKHTVLHGAHRYDEAIEAFKIMLSKLESAPDTQTQSLRQQYISPSETEGIIQETIKAQLDDAPHRLINTSTGRLCSREVQISAFKMTAGYKELLSSTMKYADLRTERIKDVVAMYFRYVMLSHRWEGKEPLLHDIQGKVVYDLDPVGGIAKLQSFCKTARDMGTAGHGLIRVASTRSTMSSCNNRSILCLFGIATRHLPSSTCRMFHLRRSLGHSQAALGTREDGRSRILGPQLCPILPEGLVPISNDRFPNHKDSIAIMQEMGDATGIDAQALIAFRPGMRDARQKLQWVSARVTTWPEDIAYSLFGIFGVNLPVIYGEKKQKALGRLLQEVVAQSGDISALNWVGQSSEFNSCLPADITSYKAPPHSAPSLSEDEIQVSISSLRHVMALDVALKLYAMLDNLNAPRFANCRLHLPCIAFRVTAVKRSPTQDQEIYEVKADGLHDLLITTKDKLVQFSSPRPTVQTLLLVRPWNRFLLELPDVGEPSGLPGYLMLLMTLRARKIIGLRPGLHYVIRVMGSLR